MPEVANTQSHSQDLHLTLNSDGQRHPILNIAAVFTLLAGVAAFACGLIVRAHAAGTALGIAAFAVGLLTQLNSATREQRVLTVAGIIAAFVGMALSIAHGAV
ncbi:MAG: hypothetical protein ACRDPO_39450 [Streptosporangiaceae bacterium]